MTREQKLEAALRKVIDESAEYIAGVSDIHIFCIRVIDVVTQRELCETLDTSPTSEWNEAIEECARRCSYEKARELRALKRKEQP